MNPGTIRSFLLRHPKPAKLRVHTTDDRCEEMDVTGRKYASVAESVHALGPELLECLDKNGKLIRALRTEQGQRTSSAVAETPELLAADPETARLTHFANLLHRAYEHSQEVAFTKLVEMFDRVNERSESVETRLERVETQYRRSLRDQIENEYDHAEEVAELVKSGASDDQLQRELFGTFLQGFHAQRQQNGAAKKPNGKGGS